VARALLPAETVESEECFSNRAPDQQAAAAEAVAGTRVAAGPGEVLPRQPLLHAAREKVNMMTPPFMAVGLEHQEWAEIGSSDSLVRQLRFGLKLPWRQKPSPSARVRP
jgi:hypothetical protein